MKKIFLSILLFTLCSFSSQVTKASTDEYKYFVVTDQYGTPLPGVAIQIVGTNIGTLTDIDGKAQLPSRLITYDTTITFSYFGAQTLLYDYMDLLLNKIYVVMVIVED